MQQMSGQCISNLAICNLALILLPDCPIGRHSTKSSAISPTLVICYLGNFASFTHPNPSQSGTFVHFHQIPFFVAVPNICLVAPMLSRLLGLPDSFARARKGSCPDDGRLGLLPDHINDCPRALSARLPRLRLLPDGSIRCPRGWFARLPPIAR